MTLQLLIRKQDRKEGKRKELLCSDSAAINQRLKELPPVVWEPTSYNAIDVA